MPQKNQCRKESFGYNTISRIPDDIKGVHGFWLRNTGRCLYIGRSNSIKDRLYQHWGNCDNPLLKSWLEHAQEENENPIEICYFLEVKHGSIAEMEYSLIKKWHPVTNIQGNTKSSKQPIRRKK